MVLGLLNDITNFFVPIFILFGQEIIKKSQLFFPLLDEGKTLSKLYQTERKCVNTISND